MRKVKITPIHLYGYALKSPIKICTSKKKKKNLVAETSYET